MLVLATESVAVYPLRGFVFQKFTDFCVFHPLTAMRTLLLGISAKEPDMNKVGPARIDQWYLRQDKGEAFVVTAYDNKSRTIEIQNFDGDIDEIDKEAWRTLPLEFG